MKILRRLLNEPLMGFLALMAVALALVPGIFDVSAALNNFLEAAQWAIIGVFALEYGLGLFLAPSKKAFVLGPWRLLDLFTIVVPLATLLPQVSSSLRSSPALRLIRLTRAVLMGARVGGLIAREEARRAAPLPTVPVEVTVLREGEGISPQPASWGEFLRWVKAPREEWYHVSNLGIEQMAEVTSAIGLPPATLESHLLGAGYPHLEVSERYSMLFVWLPSVSPEGEIETERNGLLLLATRQTLFTLSRRPTDLLATVASSLHKLRLPQGPFPARMTYAFLRSVLDRNEEVVGRFERELRALEEVPVRESRPQFLEHTFRLKKELSAAKSDLWRLKGILGALAESRVVLPGAEGDQREFFQVLLDDADYLYETVENTRDGLLSLIDLHLNVVSFEMNRVMRVLAVVSVLGLIPAVVGGLFGMNLADNPWPFTLSQVAFGVCMGMIFCLYFFFVKGWLR